MTPSEYLPLAQRTEKIPERPVPLGRYHRTLARDAINLMLHVAALGDNAKRQIVCDAEPKTVPKQKEYDPSDFPPDLTPAQFRLLHALLGKISELGELIEVVMPAITTGGSGLVDTVNLQEEMGDDEWYDAILMNVFLISPEAVLQCNIDKLRARYPEKFTEAQAVNRDLEKERKIMDAVFTPLEASK